MSRIDSLDWQRGLLAFSIMIYHLTGWEIHRLDSSALLGRLGVYGVSMFFVLSGLSMAFVYNGFINDFRSSVVFFVRRLFRIWPLLWVAILVVTADRLLHQTDPKWTLVVLNVTTTFGFFKPNAYLNIGAWSIGNEMVYYALTPLIITTYNKNKLYGNALVMVSCLIGIFFSMCLLTPDKLLATQWVIYINPFNNLFLYYTGVAIYYNSGQSYFSKKIITILFFLSLTVFIFYPSKGNQINIVTGIDRIVFSVASVVLVLAFYKNTFIIPKIIAHFLAKLGEISYGVYILHPIMYHQVLLKFFNKAGHHHHTYLFISLTAISTIMVALILFKMLETPCIKLGKRLTFGVPA